MSRALSFMADPALAASGPARPRHRFQHPDLPLRRRHPVHDGRSRQRGSPRRPAVRGHGHRDPLHRRADGPGLALGSPGPAAADGPRRGDSDLPGAAAVLAVRLRRQGHPSGRRRPRRGSADRPLGRPRPPGRPRHQLSQGLPARHHRRHHARRGRQAVRAGVMEGPRPGPRHPPRRREPGHDPPAPRRVRPGHPRRLRPRHRPPAARVEEPRLPPRPPPRPAPGRARRDRRVPGPRAARTRHPRPRTAEWLPGNGTSYPWS